MSFDDEMLDKLIFEHFSSGPVEHDYPVRLLLDLFTRSHETLSQLPTLLELSGPLVICGDIHGQYADLLSIFQECGWPFNTRYLFLGDYVDRGQHSLEVLVLLVALQLRFPRNVHLLRGNHETPSINHSYGFFSQLRGRYSHDINECDQIFDSISNLYSQLPLAALVCSSILCLHGGLSPNINSLNDIREIKRGQMEPSGTTEDVIWADPSPTCVGFAKNDYRNCSYTFGDDVITEICEKLNLEMIIRGHQVVDYGVQMSNNNRVMTLFSAPSYINEYHNRAAVVKISRSHDLTVTYLKARKMRRLGKTESIPRSTY